MDLAWSAASPFCSGPASYDVYRSATPDFVPGDGNRIASGITGTGYADLGAPSLETVYYVVRAVDSSNGSEDSNLVHVDARATGPVADGTFTTGAEPGDPILDTSVGNAPEHAGWHITDAHSHAPSAHSFWSLSNSQPVRLARGRRDADRRPDVRAQLLDRLGHRSQAWDGGVLDVSTNGGTSWSRLTPNEGYPGTLTNATAERLRARPGDAGASSSQGHFTFDPYTVDLSGYQGQTIRLRWQYSSDSLVNYEGWYVDDIVVSHAQVPGACIDNRILFADFETGDTSQWSSAVP